MLVLDADLPILPSTDSDSLPRLHRISPTHIDRQSEGYAPGLACHRSPFVQPLETEARPLRHFSIDDQPIDDEDACHGQLEFQTVADTTTAFLLMFSRH